MKQNELVNIKISILVYRRMGDSYSSMVHQEFLMFQSDANMLTEDALEVRLLLLLLLLF